LLNEVGPVVCILKYVYDVVVKSSRSLSRLLMRFMHLKLNKNQQYSDDKCYENITVMIYFIFCAICEPYDADNAKTFRFQNTICCQTP